MSVYALSKCISPKIDVIGELELELASYDSAVEYFDHYILQWLS